MSPMRLDEEALQDAHLAKSSHGEHYSSGQEEGHSVCE